MQIITSSSGKIKEHVNGYKYFIPKPLPPVIEYSQDTVNALSRADNMIGKLSSTGQLLPNPDLLIKPFVTREAVLSSKIEGTHTTIEQILAHDAGARNSSADLQEVKNYITALDYGLDRLKEIPLSLILIKEIHQKLMFDVRGGIANPGEFRKIQNWIGMPGSTVMNAKYVPPSPNELDLTLSCLETFLHNDTLPNLIHLALCHYQFEAIHPFLDGNGRVGRLLIILLLIHREVLPAPLLYLSAFFESTRDSYYKYLFEVSAYGNWNEWIIYFCNGIALQAEDVIRRITEINATIDDWLLQSADNSSGLMVQVIRHLVSNPFITPTNIAEEFDVAFSTANRLITKLSDLEIIKQEIGDKRGRIFCARKILEILETPATINYNQLG